MKNIIFIIFIFFTAQAVFAKDITKKVSGVGFSKREAVSNALINALAQIKGTHIDAKQKIKSHFNEQSLYINNIGKETTSSSSENTEAISQATKGIIKSYSIIYINKNINEYEALVEVTVPVYKAPGFNPHKRRKIAVMPFYSSKKVYLVDGKKVKAFDVAQKMTQNTVSFLTQSRKFTILDRENSRAYKKEVRFIKDKNTDKSELIKLGKKLATDYLLVANIISLEVTTKKENLDITGQEFISKKYNVGVQYRIVVMATQQVKWSDTITLNGTLDKEASNNLISYLASLIGKRIVTDIISNIYPLRIVGIDDYGNAVISQGASTIDIDEIFNVYSEGKKLIDSYTGEFLGYAESKVGEIKIFRVTPKLSYAKVIDGYIKKKMLIRKQKNTNDLSNTEEATGTTDVMIKEGGGVVLPF